MTPEQELIAACEGMRPQDIFLVGARYGWQAASRLKDGIREADAYKEAYEHANNAVAVLRVETKNAVI